MIAEYLRTTCSVDPVVYEVVTEGRSDFTAGELAVLCLQKYLDEAFEIKISDRKTVEYSASTRVEIINIRLTRREYEMLQWLRIITKRSISSIICEAVMKYHKVILRADVVGLLYFFSNQDVFWFLKMEPIIREYDPNNIVMQFESKKPLIDYLNQKFLHYI